MIALAVRAQNHGRIGRVPTEILRLIGEKTLHRATKIRAKARVIFFVRFRQELRDDIGVQTIDHRRILAIVQAKIFLGGFARLQTADMVVFHGVDRHSVRIECGFGFTNDIMFPIFAVF